MTKWTKADIDALVDGLLQNGALDPASANGFASDCYLAAGLTAEGERKPERVRCHLYQYDDGRPMLLSFEPIHGTSYCRHHLGWFVPDGAE